MRVDAIDERSPPPLLCFTCELMELMKEAGCFQPYCINRINSHCKHIQIANHSSAVLPSVARASRRTKFNAERESSALVMAAEGLCRPSRAPSSVRLIPSAVERRMVRMLSASGSPSASPR